VGLQALAGSLSLPVAFHDLEAASRETKHRTRETMMKMMIMTTKMMMMMVCWWGSSDEAEIPWVV
jgi:hypothetical protein